MRMRALRYAFTVLLAGWAMATVTQTPSAIATTAGFEKQTKSDQWIRWRVDALLQNDDRFDYRDVDVVSTNGAVTLQGLVFTQYEKGHAALIAGNVPGVRQITNEIRVVPPLNDNVVLAKKVRTQILKNPTFNVDALDVRARQGAVELRGMVSSPGEKARLGQLVGAMPGVTEVVNEIIVETGTS